MHWHLGTLALIPDHCIASLDVAECVSGDTFLSDSVLNERIGNILNVCAIRELGADIFNL